MKEKEKAVNSRAATQIGTTAIKNNLSDNTPSSTKSQQSCVNLSTTQVERVLHYLQHNRTLNCMEAQRKLNVLRLAARIKDLRAKGHRISTHWIDVFTGEGRSHRVVNYVLESSKQRSPIHRELPIASQECLVSPSVDSGKNTRPLKLEPKDEVRV